MRRSRGMTLIEIVVMVAVAAALLTGLSRGLQIMIQRSVEIRNYNVALNLAKKEMAAMNNAAYPAVAAEAALTADAAFPGFIPTQEVVSVATSGANSIRQITIRVRRDSITGPVLVRLDTYRTDIVSFGDGV